MRIVDDDNITTLTRHLTTNTDGEVLTTFAGAPSGCGLTVLGQSHAGEDVFVGDTGVAVVVFRLLTGDQVTNAATEPRGQRLGVRRLNDLLLREFAKKPRGEQPACQFALGMPRCHVDDQPAALASSDALEGLGHNVVVRAGDEIRPHQLHEVDKTAARFLDLLEALALLEQVEDVFLVLTRQAIDVPERVVEIEV